MLKCVKQREFIETSFDGFILVVTRITFRNKVLLKFSNP
jgi:hypothetical protein